MSRAARSWALWLLLTACGNEGEGAPVPGNQQQLSAPTPSALPPAIKDVVPDETEPHDGGGLEFDPSTKRLIFPESGPPRPRPLKVGVALPTDSLNREEQVGVVLAATFKPRNVPTPAKANEIDAAGLDSARRLTAPTVTVVATALGRMKMVTQSRALPLPFRSELRARYDKLGHLALWPGLAKYRILPAGALRTTFGERRVDVTPLVAGSRVKAGTGKVLDTPTRSVTLESALARIRLEIASVPEAGAGGPLLCRALVEMAGIDPTQSECKTGEIVLFAAIDWLDGGGIDFEATGLERKSDLPPGEVLVPPPSSEMVTEGLPEAPDGIYLTQTELAAFRTKPVLDFKPAAGAPADGFIAENGRDFLMVLWLDGVPVVGVPPQSQRYVVGPLKGRYLAQWRTFLGEQVDEPVTVEIPAVVRNVSPKNDQDAGL
ncbi:MAG: hypothetical protein JNL21_06890 [Myxococcales bacterium]|nr:hypothetical protein [Myxococcales bacterium]